MATNERTMKWAVELSTLLYTGDTDEVQVAETRLSQKCDWEKMTRTAVLMEWGDPRTWKSCDKVGR